MKEGSQHIFVRLTLTSNFPGGSDGKDSACSAGDPGSIPQAGRSRRKGNGNPFQCSCLGSLSPRRRERVKLDSVTKQQQKKFFFSVAKRKSNSNTILNEIHLCMY